MKQKSPNLSINDIKCKIDTLLKCRMQNTIKPINKIHYLIQSVKSWKSSINKDFVYNWKIIADCSLLNYGKYKYDNSLNTYNIITIDDFKQISNEIRNAENTDIDDSVCGGVDGVDGVDVIKQYSYIDYIWFCDLKLQENIIQKISNIIISIEYLSVSQIEIIIDNITKQ